LHPGARTPSSQIIPFALFRTIATPRPSDFWRRSFQDTCDLTSSRFPLSKMLNPHAPNVYISTNFAKNNAIQSANSKLYDHLPKTYHPIEFFII
jgi:hypothetical protein